MSQFSDDNNTNSESEDDGTFIYLLTNNDNDENASQENILPRKNSVKKRVTFKEPEYHSSENHRATIVPTSIYNPSKNDESRKIEEKEDEIKFEDLILIYLALELTFATKTITDFVMNADDPDLKATKNITLDLHNNKKHVLILQYSTVKPVTFLRSADFQKKVVKIQRRHTTFYRNCTMKGKTASSTSQDFSLVTYMKLYNSIKINNQNVDLKLVLCTNRKFNLELGRNDILKIVDGRDTIDIKIVRHSPEMEALYFSSINNTISKCYKFEITNISNSYKTREYINFFHNFILVTDIMNVDELEETVRDNFKMHVSKDEESFEAFRKYMETWSQSQGKKKPLERRVINEVLSHIT